MRKTRGDKPYMVGDQPQPSGANKLNRQQRRARALTARQQAKTRWRNSPLHEAQQRLALFTPALYALIRREGRVRISGKELEELTEQDNISIEHDEATGTLTLSFIQGG